MDAPSEWFKNAKAMVAVDESRGEAGQGLTLSLEYQQVTFDRGPEGVWR